MSDVNENKILGILKPEESEEEELTPKTYSMDVGNLTFDDMEDDGDGEETLFSSDEDRLNSLGDKIIASLISSNAELRRFAQGRLMTSVSPMLFRNENHIIFSVLFNYRDKLKSINIDDEFISMYLNRNRGIITKAKNFINYQDYEEVDGSWELGYIVGVLKKFNLLEKEEPISIDDFNLFYEKYLIEFKAIEASKIYERCNVILNNGMSLKGKKLFGFEDSLSYLKRSMADIEGVTSTNMGSGFTTMREQLMEEKPDEKKPIKIGDFDNLEALNKYYGGIYSGLFYQVLAPPKAGKTKLCSRICHTVAVKFGNNVSVWAAEGGKEKWTAQMRAIHFDYTYNTGVSPTERKFGVSQEVILHDTFPTDEIRDCEQSSKLDLATNEGYGSIDYIDRPFNVETFIEDIDTSVNHNNSRLVIIDYLQLIGSERNLDSVKRISEAYVKLLKYCNSRNVAVLTPAQYKQATFDEIVKSSSSGFDMRTAGGGSAEVLRTPDVTFALWATTTDLINNKMKILSMPCRLNRAFPEIDVLVDLGVCEFVSV